MLRNVTAPFVGLLMALSPALASAEEATKSYADCGREPTDAEVAAAKGAFQAGNASFNEADYARAIDYWEDAYRRDCTANPLLLNLARAYELAGRKRQAVVSLQTFLAREPNSSEREQISRRIDVLNKKIAEEDAAAAAAAPVKPSADPSAPAADGPHTSSSAEPAAAQARSPWPWILMGTGGALALVGGITYGANKAKINDLDLSQCDPPESHKNCPTKIRDDGNAARNGMNAGGALAVLGVATAGAGLVWYFVAQPATAPSSAGRVPARKARLTPVVSPFFSGVSLTGAF